MQTLTASNRPDRVPLDVGGRKLVFVRVADDRYAAEVDGNGLPIRTTRETSEVFDGGGSRPWSPEVHEGETADIDALLYCLSLGAVPEPVPIKESPRGANQHPVRSPPGVTLTASDNWGHFRQWTFLKVTVTIAPSGAVEIHEDVGEMDGSYY
jgi:hypothetical protein